MLGSSDKYVRMAARSRDLAASKIRAIGNAKPGVDPMPVSRSSLVITSALIYVHTAATAHAQPNAHIQHNPSNWLSERTRAIIDGCTLIAADGTTIFTPDATHSYGAQWTRDFQYMVAASPELLDFVAKEAN